MGEKRNRAWILASRPVGQPGLGDFELVERDVPEPDPGEILVRTCYLSVDPYMRSRMRAVDGYADAWTLDEIMPAGVVGEVVQTAHPDWSQGDIVQGRLQWAEYGTISGDEVEAVDPSIAPISTSLGVLGMPGRTAYVGMREIACPQPGETVVVSAAAGAVGSVATQLARLAGARVVGIAGTEEKCDWLETRAGADATINYRETNSPAETIEDATPDGVDAYFDNVGGTITDAVFGQLNPHSRVAVCGQIALYNLEETPTGPRKLPRLIGTRTRVEGFLVGDFAHRQDEATARLAAWIDQGDLAYEETITEGIERAPEAFIGLFEGTNLGKQLVHVADPGTHE